MKRIAEDSTGDVCEPSEPYGGGHSAAFIRASGHRPRKPGATVPTGGPREKTQDRHPPTALPGSGTEHGAKNEGNTHQLSLSLPPLRACAATPPSSEIVAPTYAHGI